MLDIVDYVPSKRLCELLIIEPSCGDGSFLECISKLLSKSALLHKNTTEELASAVRAYDLDKSALNVALRRCAKIFDDAGFDGRHIVGTWLTLEDFITASKPYADIVIGNPPYVRAKNIDRNRLINYIEA